MRTFFNPVELANTVEIPLEQAQGVSISYISESIFVYPTDGDTIVLKEYLNQKDPSYFARVHRDAGNIIIRHGERPLIFGTLRGYIEVFLPRDYYGALNIKTVSGKIQAEGRMVLSDLAISNTSGRISLGDVTSGTVVLATVSGSIDVSALKALANLNSTSGSIRVGSASGDGEYQTVSGSIDVSYQAVTGDITCTSTSGRVRLAVPSMLSFGLEAKSVSGSVHVPMPGTLSGGRHSVTGTVGSAPSVKIRLKTVSGRIEIISA